MCWGGTCWQVTCHKKGKRTDRTSRKFPLSKFMKEGLTEAEADAAALEAAKAFRAELVEQGVLKEPKPADLNFTSEVPGVSWTKASKKWHVQLTPIPGRSGFMAAASPTLSRRRVQGFGARGSLHGLERRV